MKMFAFAIGSFLTFFGAVSLVSLAATWSSDPLAFYELLIGLIFLLSGLLLVVRMGRLMSEANRKALPPAVWDQVMRHRSSHPIPPRPDTAP
jgi:hypothetical protein